MSLKIVTDLFSWFRKTGPGCCSAPGAIGALLLTVLFLTPQAQAAPFNDNFADAGLLTGDSGTTTGDNFGALSEPGEPLHAGVPSLGSVWWAWSPDTAGSFRFDTFGTGFDTVLAVYTGSDLESLTEIAASDDFGLSAQSAVSFEAVTTETYYITVASKGLSAFVGGQIFLNWEPCGNSLSAPDLPLPADGETTSVAVSRLDWDDVPGALEYEIFVDGLSIGRTTTSSFLLTMPVESGEHEWQVVARDVCSSATSPLWRFTVCSSPEVPADPFPGLDMTVPCGAVTLDWSDAAGALSYDVYVDAILVGSTTSSSLTVSSGLSGGVHSWMVVAVGDCDVTTGPIWSFCLTDTPAGPLPGDGETTSCNLARLDWEDACGATAYDVYLDSEWLTTVSTSDLILTAPLAGGAHTWQVVAHGACGNVPGPLWSFCLLDPPSNPVAPFDGESLAIPPTLLDWEDACGATTYTVFLNGTLLGQSTVSQIVLPTVLEDGTTHTWQVVAEGECPLPAEGVVWQFSINCQAPGVPSAPVPADGETTGCGLTMLDWADAPGAASYRVVLDGVEMGSTSVSAFPLPSPLTLGHHEWQIIAVSHCGAETPGGLLSFCLLDTPDGPITPADQEALPGLVDTFDWADACGATTYTLLVDGVVQGVTSTSLFTLIGGPLPGGSHTWQVVAENDCSVTTGPVWTFTSGCTLVSPPSNPVPADGSITDTPITQISWDPVPGVTGYKVYINGNFVATVTDPFLTVSLGIGEYTWQVGANTLSCGEVHGPVWTFTVCSVPGEPTPITPADGVTTSPDNLFFDWSDAENAQAYLLVIDNTTFGSVSESHFQMPYPINSGPHVWHVVAQSGCGVTTSTDFTFCALRAPSIPNPRDNSSFCVPPGVLDWEDVESATGYDVYLDGQLVSANQSQSRYELPQTLGVGQHTWQVVARNECGEVSGPLWRLNILAQATTQGNLWTTNGSVYAMAVSGNVIYIGGNFTEVCSADGSEKVMRKNLAAVDMTTGRAIDWAADTDAPVRALACDSDVLYIGGEFDRVAGEPRSQIAAVNMNTGALLSWNPGANGVVQALAVDDSNVYVGGRFTILGGAMRRYAGAVSKDGGTVTVWGPSPNGYVRALCVVGTNVYIGGEFSIVGGQICHGLAVVDTALGTLHSWNPGVDKYVYAIAPAGSRIYVGGLFNMAGGQPRRNLACFNTATGQVDPWVPETNGAVNAIAVTDNAVFLGGLFSLINDESRPYLGVVGTASNDVPNCGYDPDFPVHCLAVYGNTVCVGGDFTYIGTTSLRGFAGFGGTGSSANVSGWKRY